MKKEIVLIMALFMALLGAQALAEPATVPESTLHAAVLTLTWPDENGEFWAEGHVVLDTEQKGDSVTVYAQVTCQNYGFMAGIFTDTGGGMSGPVAITFHKTGNEYNVQGIQQAEDDTDDKKILSPKALKQMQRDGEKNTSEMDRQMTEQAKAYLVGIGRTEPVQDWRDLGLQNDNLLTVASNLTVSLTPPYPLWVTTTEQLENGIRYLYTRAWAPDGKTKGDNGETGTVTLTKTRREDQKVMETITICAEPEQLTVTYQDDGGTKAYRFAYDGSTYHQPTITQTGTCAVSYPSFEQSFVDLPQ